MDMVQTQWKERKKRTVNFSLEEVKLLTSEVKSKQHVLFGDLTGTGISPRDRDRLWLGISKKVNALGVANRSVKELKRKWIVLKSVWKKDPITITKHWEHSKSPSCEETLLNEEPFKLEPECVIKDDVRPEDEMKQDRSEETECTRCKAMQESRWTEERELWKQELELRKRELKLKEEEISLKKQELELKRRNMEQLS